MFECYSQKLVNSLPYAYACCRTIFDRYGSIVDSTFLEINPAFEAVFNVKSDALTNKSVIDFFADFDLNTSTLFQKLANIEHFELEEVYNKRKREWFKLNFFALDRETFALQLQNITNVNIDLDFLFNSAQDCMFMAEYINGNFYYIYLNAAHEKITGFQNYMIAGKTPVEVWGKETGERLAAFYYQAITQNENQLYEEVLSIGTKTHHFLTSLSLAIKAGHQYIIVSRKDITTYKELEENHLVLMQRLQSMFNHHVANMLIIDPTTGTILDANPSACEFYGYQKSELLSMNIQDINMLPASEVAKKRRSAFERQQEYFIFPHRLSSGEIRLVEAYSCPIGLKETPQLFSIIFDVTDRETYKSNLFFEKELLNTTLKSIGDGVVTTDLAGKITSLNSIAEKIVGWGQDEAIGMDFSTIFVLKNEETEEPVESPVEKVLKTGKIIGLANHTIIVNRFGERISIADSAAPIKNESGQIFGVVMVFRDIRSEKKHQDEILYLSYHDALTGLYNRRFVETELNKLNLDKRVPVSVIMGDVNGLKITNDVFGHAIGDELLKNVSAVFNETCTPNDIVARWGGDEFLLILPNRTIVYAEETTEQLRENFKKRKVGTLQLSVSLGCAERSNPGQEMEDVIRQAEEWMYHQKLLDGKSYRNAIVNTLLATLYEKSMETEEHTKRLFKYCEAIGKELKLSDKTMNELSLLSVLHDIGKVGIHQSILKKPGPLLPDEWIEMKKHCEIGYRITQNTPELSLVSEYILYHHERWDGNGYPKGLRGEEIPICCRILAVADAFDAMTNDRIYRKALNLNDAIKELKNNAGTQFAPYIVDHFIEVLKKEHGKQMGSCT
ncbi:PAS domain S-box protein [Oscillospiraceae bacterium LTW-04]|nr:PAS domain S-box protein [Oscillospiraceae bacterium MB24-C1]